MEKISVIITVRNEQKTLPALLHSIEAQTLLPNEVVIVDGDSTDGTVALLRSWKPKFPVQILQKEGNRSVGRNAAIAASHHPIIAITDAGCVLDKDWLRNITKPFSSGAEVVAGYYAPLAKNAFERAAAAFMLVQPENVDESHFLPATRSMALHKSIWLKVGRFNERYTYNEDYVFAKMLEKMGAKMAFARTAIVYWSPPTSWRAFYLQVYKFAYGDAYSGILRPKVALIYLRYVIFLLTILSAPLFIALGILYCIWAIAKHFKHVNSVSALVILPIMQIGTDLVVMFGTARGFVQRMMHANKD
jgi:glycosyltransferase involved in cell wall biosynthesis